MTRMTDANPLVASTILEERLRRVEDNQQVIENRLANSYTQGRIRFDRTSPTSSADVQTPDRLYDIVRDTSYEYVLINDAGTLAWRRISYSAF
jgi:hypothetical protein